MGYVGAHGYHEILGIDANEPFPVICPKPPCPAAIRALSRWDCRHSGSGRDILCPDREQAERRPQQYLDLFLGRRQPYNALQIDASHRFSSGLSLRGVYTWSKTIDDGDSLNATTSGNEPALVLNSFNLHSDRGLANFDV